MSSDHTVQTLTSVRPQIAVAMVLFVLAGGIGALNPQLGDQALTVFSDVVQEFMEKSTPDLIFSIFVRNATAAGIVILLGGFFGLVPLAAILFNGILFGAVVRLMPGEAWRLVPHGIFELPAIFIAWGLGLWISLWIREPPRWQRLKQRLAASLHVYLVLILPLLIVAAVIEGLAAHIYRS